MHPLLIHLAKAQLHFGRGCYIESKLPVATAVSHKKEIISSSTVDDMVKFIHCNIGNGHCKVERQQQSVDVEFTVACDICESIVSKCTKEEFERTRAKIWSCVLICILFITSYGNNTHHFSRRPRKKMF